MHTLILIIIATLVDGIVALAGAVTLAFKKETMKKLLGALVAFSAGALIAGAFFHIMPEALEEMEPLNLFMLVILGFVIFFLFEKFLFWHHCHKDDCSVHPYTYLILFGDGIHNFIDGLIIAAAFLVDAGFGVITTLMIISHELPQELGDFAVLVHGGMKRRKALFYNFLSQLTAVAGGIIGYFIGSAVTAFVPFMLSFAAGGFIYIGASDLIPQLHEEKDIKKSLVSFVFFVVGILFMLALKLFFEE